MKILKAVFELLRDAGMRWAEDKASIFAAALSYYTLFSLTPLLLLALAIASRLLREANVQELIINLLNDFSPDIATFVSGLLLRNDVQEISSAQDLSSLIAAIISTAILFWGATGVFNHLKRALNTIWGVEPELPTGLHGVLYFIQTRGLASLMVLGVGFLFVAAFVLNTVLTTLDQIFIQWFPELAGELDSTLITFILSWAVPAIAFAIIFKALPDARVAWRDVWLGAGVTAVLFALGNYGIRIFLRFSGASSAYGAAGSLVVVLLWIYYSAQIFFYGAEFTKVYADRYGSKVVPANNAVAIRRERVNGNHDPKLEPELVELPAYLPEPLYLPEPGDSPTRQKAKQVGFGFIGLAVGLFLGFLTSLRRD